MVTVTDWAVGRSGNAPLVALRLNRGRVFLLQVTQAKELAAALQAEAEAVARAKPEPENQR